MCGITAILQLSKNSSIKKKTLRCIQQLENRGYDSVGVFFEGYEDIHKSIDRICNFSNSLKDREFVSRLSMAHTRWATHGNVCVQNAHPHTSSDGNIVIVHNGIVDNYDEMKRTLQSSGIQFTSDTDTEVICNLLRYNERQYKKKTFKDVISITLAELKGTWSLVIYNKKYPETLFATCKGCPLLVGLRKDLAMCIVSSEKSGFADFMDSYFILPSDWIETIRVDQKNARISHESERRSLPQLPVSNDTICLSSHPFKHWTLKEINDQPHVVQSLLHNYVSKSTGTVDIISRLSSTRFERIDHVVFVACGTSLNACLLGEKYFKDVCHFVTVHTIEASEFDENDIPRSDRLLFIFLSQSGETKDVHHVLQTIKGHNIGTLSIVNVEDSLISRETDDVIYTKCGKEYGVASTKCFTAQVLVLKLLALNIAQVRFGMKISTQKSVLRSLHEIPQQIASIISKFSKDYMRTIKTLDHTSSLIILGRGKTYPISREAALKIKEISYIHAESFASGSLKHGPLALVDPHVPVMLIKLKDSTLDRTNHIHHELVARRGKVIVVGHEMECDQKNTLNWVIPYNGHFDEILSVVPFQLLAYYLAIDKDNDPDFPRNLAKSVVVY